ncbi:MAG: AbrB/MazE/SpoVT family DNA-binding domain-containing protein [Desulfobacterales bacterium]|nr:AbrB/MazE/SpoVT family DNA-binding domain-containing protein [Desulfobacterales bacterium]
MKSTGNCQQKQLRTQEKQLCFPSQNRKRNPFQLLTFSFISLKVILPISYRGGFSMPTTILSSKGQVIIPKSIREEHHWEPGQRLEVIKSGEGVQLKPVEPFSKTTLADVAACLQYKGKAKTLAEMEDAIRKGAQEAARDRG